MPICDFCSTTPVVWCYPAEDFVAYRYENLVGQSLGGWAACQDCGILIEAGDRDGLARRSAAKLIDANPDMAELRDSLVEQMQGLHAIFFANRIGDAAAAD